MTTKKPLINRAAVAERLGTTERHIRELVWRRAIPCIKVGGVWRFDPDEIEAWIEDNSKDPVS